MSGPFDGKGHWAGVGSARSETGARAFLDAQKTTTDWNADYYRRSLLLRRRVRARIRALFHRG